MNQVILSQELFLIVADLNAPASVRRRLIACAKFAKLLEQELAVHRLGEAGNTAKSLMEAEAAKALTAGTVDDDGKVVRPEFGRRP